MEIKIDLEGGRYFFNAVKEGDSVLFACDDENESHLWVMAMYRATGQAHKPAPPLTPAAKNSTISKIQGGRILNWIGINMQRQDVQFCFGEKK